jgi:bifunctional non-homologous end joining protein LigD
MARPLPGSHPDARRIVNARARSGGARVVEVAGVRVSHPDRVFFPDDGITKLELARYYQAIAPAMVPHVRGRPLTLVRCPDTIAECAYVRHVRAWGPSALRRVTIRERAKLGEYLVADDAAGLVALAQMDILEIHTWNATVAELERPDRLVIDLDPGAGVAWSDVAAAAQLVRRRLRALGLAAFAKTTGGKGLHVVVPLVPSAEWALCLDFARALCTSLARQAPERLTAHMGKQQRVGRVYLDYLRNNRTNTSVAAFSTRARRGAPVSAPIAWRELARPPAATLRTIGARLRRQRRDPWAGYHEAARPLTPSLLRALT